MQKPRFTETTLAYYRDLLTDSSKTLIGVAFFVKEAGQVFVIGDIAGCGVASSSETLWDAIENYDTISRMQDAEIAKEFGEEVVQFSLSEEDMIAKTAAIESLKTSLKDRPGIVDVRETPTSIVVIVTGVGQYDGPWDWEGFPVHAETEV